jgi:ketosteroid isomerase-like protein
MAQRNIEAIRRSGEAWRRGDWDAFIRDVDPDVEFVELPAFGHKVHHGRDGLVDFLRWWPSQWDSFRAELKQVVAVGDDQVVSLNRHYARMKDSGFEVEEEVAFLTTFRSGKAIRVEMFRSLDDALEAAGQARASG